MYTIITLYAIGYIFFAFKFYKEFGGGYDWTYVIILPLFTSLVFGIAGLIIAIALPVEYETTSWTENIVTLKDNNSVEGSFFLGTGMINGSMKYVYYQKNNDSTYQMWQADYYRAKIRYTKEEPLIIITDKHQAKTALNKWAVDLDDESLQTYIFEVPQGSIKNSYELDAQ